MRKISADYIFTGKQILKNGILEIDDNGKIISVTDTKGKLEEQQSLEFYNGIITPGFVNAHCHLELSHLKGTIENSQKRGLPGFIEEIKSKKNFQTDIDKKIKNADIEMKKNGIVAVGDISNTDVSFYTKKTSSIYYHTFIETFTISKKKATKALKTAEKNLKKAKNIGIPANIVPHAAYSVPDYLYKKISELNNEKKRIISVHNQETESEDILIKYKTGALAEVLKKKGFVFDDFSYPGNSATEVNLNYLNAENNILLIHNTFTKEKDINFAEKFSENIYWVFCPLSNLYIEKKLPDLYMFFGKKLKTCIGTDSYASNTELSILSEMKTITENFPEIPFADILKSATLNGAEALGIQDKYGSFEIGKTPGINLITKFDFEKMTLSDKSSVKPLV